MLGEVTHARVDPEPDDPTVVARVLSGEIQQFAILVERYQGALYRHALALVLDRSAAMDMAQDAFVRAYANLRNCRDHARFKAWLFQTLRNRCLDYLKEARRRDVPLDRAVAVADAAEGPEDGIDRMRLRHAIKAALLALPDAHREAFLMHYVEGVPYEEMAERLDASVSALKMRVLRARQALAAALREGDVTVAVAARLSIGRG